MLSLTLTITLTLLTLTITVRVSPALILRRLLRLLLTALMQTITDLLTTNPFICLIALDFSKAFDTVCHDTLLGKMALLNIPDNRSQILQVSASIIQGSAISPVSCDINASDLSTVTPGNLMYTYADDPIW